MNAKTMTVPVVVALLIVVVPAVSRGEAPYPVAWSRQIGTSAFDMSYSVAVDAWSNAYISGETRGSLAGTNAGGPDAFLAKYDGSGNFLWSRQIGTSDYDRSYSVAVDASGNAYISGDTWGSLGGASAGDYDAYLVKYDGSGNLLWSRQIGTSDYDHSYSVAVDASGNPYISGYTVGSLGGPWTGGDDAFLVKYDSSGSLLWSRQIGSSDHLYDRSYSVAVDASGNAYVTGETNGTLGGTNAGGYDAFLVKYDGSGNLLWSRQVGTSNDDVGRSVAVDASGNAYITGETHGSLGGTNAGGYDAFLVKYDASGNHLWSRHVGSSGGDWSTSVAVDPSGSVYISGFTSGKLSEPGLGYYDAFLCKYDESGNLLWSTQIGALSHEGSQGVAADPSGNIYISGWTDGNLGGTSAGNYDAFLIKFNVPEPATLLLLGVGGLALIRRRTRAKRTRISRIGTDCTGSFQG